MKQAFALRMGQSLTLTPALQQAIRLLQLSSLDLQQEIQEALESNVMLELEEEADEPSIEQAAAGTAEAPPPQEADQPAADAAREETETPVDVETDWEEYESTTPSSSASGNSEDLYEFRQANLQGGTTLRDHLLWQAGLAPLDDTGREIAAHLVDGINEDGYLEDWAGLCARLHEGARVSQEQIEAVLRVVQDFDPTGVGARDLAECLRLQLQQLPDEVPEKAAALQLVNAHMALMARHDNAGMQAALAVDAETLQKALAVIQSLQPHPGRPYQPAESDYVVPDVIVRKHKGRWKVSLNPDIAPKVRINPHYLSMVRRADSSRDQVTLKTHLQEARYFINGLESRNDTLLRVAQCIVEEQRAFLEYGNEAMRPLVLRDISERLGIHESTVSRATANKFMLTPDGLHELKFFFSSHVQTAAGGTASATAIQAMIKRLVGQEAGGPPLSDSQLAGILLKDGIQVARRTVAKYREAMSIPPSQERRA